MLSTERGCRVLTDVTAVERAFDYLIPSEFADRVSGSGACQPLCPRVSRTSRSAIWRSTSSLFCPTAGAVRGGSFSCPARKNGLSMVHRSGSSA